MEGWRKFHLEILNCEFVTVTIMELEDLELTCEHLSHHGLIVKSSKALESGLGEKGRGECHVC